MKKTPLDYFRHYLQTKFNGKMQMEILNFITIGEEELNNKRDYVGMSSLGGECLRKPYLSVMGADKQEFQGIRNKMILCNGHFWHGVFQYIATKIWGSGCENEVQVCLHKDENDEESPVIAKGHIDTKLENFYNEEEDEEYRVVIDYKTISHQGFLSVLGGHRKDKYWVQINGYRLAVDADKCFLIYIDRDTLDMCCVDATDEMSGMIAYNSALTINKHKEKESLPDIPYTTFAQGEKRDCRYCPYKQHCWSIEDMSKAVNKFEEEDGIIIDEPKTLKKFKEDMEKLDGIKNKLKEAESTYKQIKTEKKELEDKWKRKLSSKKDKKFIWIGNKGWKKTTEQKTKLNEEKIKEKFGMDKIKDCYDIRNVVSTRKISKKPTAVED